MEFKNATLPEALSAFVLIIKNYQEKKYLPACSSLGFFSKVVPFFCKLLLKNITFRITKGGRTFVAKEDNKVVGTMSVEFNPAVLCIDKMFPEELVAIRSKGVSFAYIGSFAVSSRKTRTCMLMMRQLETFLRSRKVGVGLCVVNPSHCGLYQKLGFQEVARTSGMDGLDNAVAVLLAIHS